MARPLRIEFEGAWYHVMNRGLSHKSIFEEDNHYETFIQLLNETSLTFAAEYHSYSNQTISDAITSITPPAISCFTCQSKKLIQQDNRMKNTFNELLSIFENNDNLKHET